MATISGARSAPVGLLRQLRLPIMDSYILAELLGPFAFAFLAFFLFWGFNIFFLAAKYIIDSGAPLLLVLQFLVYRVPQSIPFAFPFAAFFATLLAIGRLTGDNEINAIRTSGVSLARFALTPFLFGVFIFLFTYLMNEYVAPKAVDTSTRTFYQMVYHTPTLPFETQIYRHDPATGNTIFVNSVSPDGKSVQGLQVFRPARSGYWGETIQAPAATVSGSSLAVSDAVVVDFDEHGTLQRQRKAKNLRIPLPLGESGTQFTSNANADAWTMNSSTLAAQIRALRAQGIGGEALGNLETNLADKLAFPFAAVVSVLIALPMAIRFGKKGRVMGMALAIVGFFVYYILTEASAVFGGTGKVNPYIAAWLPNVLFGVGGLALLWSDEH